jgi:hypothetical protein
VTVRTKRIIHALLTSGSMIGTAWTQAYARAAGGIFIEYRTLLFLFGAGFALSLGFGILIGGRHRRDD